MAITRITTAFSKDTSMWQKIRNNLLKGNSKSVDVGFFEDAKYEDGTQVAYVAMLNEDGHINGPDSLVPGAVTPARPFMRHHLADLGDEDRSKLIDLMRADLHLVAIGKKSWKSFYDKFGKIEVEDIQKVIEQWFIPMNAPLTVQMKGFNKPLIDSETMIDSVDYRVNE